MHEQEVLQPHHQEGGRPSEPFRFSRIPRTADIFTYLPGSDPNADPELERWGRGWPAVTGAPFIIGSRRRDQATKEYIGVIDKPLSGTDVMTTLSSIAPSPFPMYAFSNIFTRVRATVADWSKSQEAGYTDEIRYAHESAEINGIRNAVAAAIARFEPHREFLIDLVSREMIAHEILFRVRGINEVRTQLFYDMIAGYSIEQDNKTLGERKAYKHRLPPKIKRKLIEFLLTDATTDNDQVSGEERLEQYYQECYGAESVEEIKNTRETFARFIDVLDPALLRQWALSAREVIVLRPGQDVGETFQEGETTIHILDETTIRLTVNGSYIMDAVYVPTTYLGDRYINEVSPQDLLTVVPALHWVTETLPAGVKQRQVRLEPLDPTTAEEIASQLTVFPTDETVDPRRVNTLLGVLTLTNMLPYLRKDWPEKMSLPNLPAQDMREAQVVALAAMGHNLRKIAKSPFFDATEALTQ